MRGMGCVGALEVMFGDLGGCLVLDRACTVRFWDWVKRILGLGNVTERQRANGKTQENCDNMGRNGKERHQMARVERHQSK